MRKPLSRLLFAFACFLLASVHPTTAASPALREFLALRAAVYKEGNDKPCVDEVWWLHGSLTPKGLLEAIQEEDPAVKRIELGRLYADPPDPYAIRTEGAPPFLNQPDPKSIKPETSFSSLPLYELQWEEPYKWLQNSSYKIPPAEKVPSRLYLPDGKSIRGWVRSSKLLAQASHQPSTPEKMLSLEPTGSTTSPNKRGPLSFFKAALSALGLGGLCFMGVKKHAKAKSTATRRGGRKELKKTPHSSKR